MVLGIWSKAYFLFPIQIRRSPTASLLWEGAELHHPPGAVPVLLGGHRDGEPVHAYRLCEHKLPQGCFGGQAFLKSWKSASFLGRVCVNPKCYLTELFLRAQSRFELNGLKQGRFLQAQSCFSAKRLLLSFTGLQIVPQSWTFAA